jgi:signal transduction histidine kinase
VLDRRAPRDGDALNGQRASDRGIGGWPLHATNMFRLIDIEQATEQRIVERDPDEASRVHSVLVVEDTPDVIRVIHLALHQHFRVLAAPDGAKGFELAVKHRPSLIVTDLMMPEFDGLELTRRLRAEPTTRHIPIVMLTARGAVDDRVRGLDSGVNAYLSKPFSGKELVSTVRSLMEAQHGTAELLLTHQMDSLEVLAGGLAHEIKNPLNYIKNALANIHRDSHKVVELIAPGRAADPEQIAVLSARIERMFQSAESGVTRIAATVDLMIRYSREGYSRTLQPYDAFQAIHDVAALVLAASGADIEFSVDLRDDGTVECVPEELNQVLTNLIQNAVDAVRSPGGKVAVAGRVDGDSLVLSIADNGVGIAPENQAKIFSAFFTTKDVGRGLGLGLTIAHRCVMALGGKIDVRSRPGEGTEFTLRLPRRSVAARVHPPSRSPVREVFA